MDVTVQIVTYNSASCIGACLASIAQQRGITAETIVVDNASSDDTLSKLASSSVRIIDGKENVGFGRANNLAFAQSTGRYIYLLNPDAQLVENDALERLCRAMEANKNWGMAGTRVLSHDGNNESEPATTYPGYRRVKRDFSKLPGRVAWCVGASLIIRREVYESLGGFDPGFFLYAEEIDFCLRLRELGHEIGFIDDVSVRHMGGASEAGRDPYDICKRKMTGIHRFWRKHYSTEDAARLIRRDKYRALFRMFCYAIEARFRKPRSRAWQKYRENRAIWETSKQVPQP